MKRQRRFTTIKGGSSRAEKSCKVLMMMKVVKLGWAGAGAGLGQGQGRSRQCVCLCNRVCKIIGTDILLLYELYNPVVL